MNKKIFIASDHAGYEIKEFIKDQLINSKISITDLGPFFKKSVDYPDYAKKVSNRVSKKKNLFLSRTIDEIEEEGIWLGGGVGRHGAGYLTFTAA